MMDRGRWLLDGLLNLSVLILTPRPLNFDTPKDTDTQRQTCQTAAAAPKRMLCLSFIMWGPFGAWQCLCFDSILRHWINYIFGRHVSRIPCVIDAVFWCKGHDFWLGPAGEVYLLHYKYSIAIKMIIAMECKFKCNRFKDNFWALILG